MTHINEIRVELKYCERCGELCFRGEKSQANLCAACAQKSPDTLPRSSGLRRACAPDRGSAKGIKAGAWYGPMTEVVERLQGVATVAGGAA